ASCGTRLGKLCVLREEAVAGVDRLGAPLSCRLENGRNIQIGLACVRRTNAYRLVRHRHMSGICVGVRIDCNGRDAHALSGTHDATGNLAAIGNEERSEHHYIRNTPNFVASTGALRQAEKASARTRRVSSGAMMPSSQSRAVAK